MKLIRLNKSSNSFETLLKWQLWAPPFVCGLLLVAIAQFNFLAFHSLAELFAIVISFVMFAFAWSTRDFVKNNFLLFLACGYFWIGSLDLLHTLVYKGIDIIVVGSGNLSVQFWIGTRYAEALLLLTAPFAAARTQNGPLLMGLFGVVSVGLTSAIFAGAFPIGFVEGQGLTAFKIYSEYAIIMILAAALWALLRFGTSISTEEKTLIFVSIVMTIFSELAFTFYVDVYGLSNLAGHIFKFASYWFIFQAIVIFNLKRPYVLLLQGQDLLERRVEDKSRQIRISKDRLTQHMNKTPLASIVWDLNFRVIEWNPSAERIFGYTKAEAIGKHARDLIIPSSIDKEVVEGDFQAVLNESGGKHSTNENVNATGHLISCEWYNTPIKDESGEIIGVASLIQDVTERNKTEQELIAVREKLNETVSQLQATLEATADGILVVSNEGKIETFNDNFIKLWRLPDEIIASQDDDRAIDFVLSQLIDPNAFTEKITKLYGMKEETSFDSLEFKDGRIFERYSKPQKIGNSIRGRVWSFRDVTKIEASKQALIIAKTEAEAASRAKTEFLSSMSHELRTPMNAILGFGQILELNAKEPLTAMQTDYVHYIMNSGEHLLALIDQVLDLAKIETGNVQLKIEDVQLSEVLPECVALIEEQANKRGISIDTSLCDPQHSIKADYTRFKQILLNLLSNAVKYNRIDGSITVASQLKEGDKIRISVSDTGTGIAVENQSDLFQPFNRLGKETGEIEGTGIGLSITKKLTEAMDGSIGFASIIGSGSTFWVEFPNLVKSNIQKPFATSLQLQDQSSIAAATILYIEDNPANLNLMKAIIGGIDGLTLISAHNAELGLTMAEAQQPSLILMDINLPGMNGIAAMKILSEIESTKNIPIIAVTAAAMKSDIDSRMTAGFKGYLTKPFNVPNLIALIKKVLNE